MKKITTIATLALALGTNFLSAQFLVKPTFFETLGVSNQGLVSGYEDQAGPYSIWNPDENLFYEIGGAAPGQGVGGACKFSADGKYLSGTNYINQDIPTDWTRQVLSNYPHIFKAIEFPENQEYTGYAAGQTLTWNGHGIILKTFNGGVNWMAKWIDTGNRALEAMSFPTLYTGFVGGWNGYFAKTTDGGESWTEIAPAGEEAVYYYKTITFKDEFSGVVTAELESGGAMVFITSDGGENWTSGTGLNGIPEKVCFAGAGTYFAVNTGGSIQKSTDNGITWNTIYTAPEMLLGITFYDGLTGIATGENACYKTGDGGATWTPFTITEGVMFRDVKWIDSMNLVAVGSSDVIFSSADGGATWTWANQAIFNGEPSLYSIAVTGQDIHVCGSQGNFYKKSRIASRIVAEMSKYDMETGQWTTLGSLGQTVDNTTSGGFNVSADGNTFVGNSWADPNNGNGYTPYAHGVAWTQADGITDLGSLYANDNRSSRANAVSGDGNVIVGYQDLNGPWKSAVWRKNPAGGYFPNEYLLINPDGSATDEFNQLGECSYVTPDGNWIGGEGDYANGNQPWIWSEATGVINLGDLSAGTGTGRVAGIAPDGSFVIGWFSVFGWGAQPIPFIWTPTTGIVEFNAFVGNVLDIDTGDYDVWIPNNLSLNAKYITGWGVNPNIGEWGEIFTFRLEMPDMLGHAEVGANISTVYPNPVIDILNIQSEETIDNVGVYNISGQLLIDRKSPNGISQIDLSALSSGIYFVKIQANQQTKIHKITKK